VWPITVRRDNPKPDSLPHHIAEVLGLSKQRAHQIAKETGFPEPVNEDVRGRLWDRREVERWAKIWRVEKPWR
jgi:predicted DNA-binding transcriptional regulator AlpA